MKKIIFFLILLFIFSTIYGYTADIKYCNKIRVQKQNLLINKVIWQTDTLSDLFGFFEAELRLRHFCNFEKIIIPNKWNYSSRLAIQGWSKDKFKFGVIALKLEDMGFSFTDINNIICNRKLEVRNEPHQ